MFITVSQTIFVTIIPQTYVVIYLGLHFDCRLNWKEHIAKKIDLKTKEINWLAGKNSHLSIDGKKLIYKAVKVKQSCYRPGVAQRVPGS
jgi:hypothetical protein